MRPPWLGPARDAPRANWVGAVLAPAIWFALFLLQLALSGADCTSMLVAIRFASLLAGIIVTGVAVLIALRNLRIVYGADERATDPTGLCRFASLSALLIAAGSCILVILLAIAVLALDPCRPFWPGALT